MAYVDHDLGLLDRINAQFTFQILVQFNEVCRISGVLDNDIDDLLRHRFIGYRCCCNRSNGLRCFGDRRRWIRLSHWSRCYNRRFPTLHSLDVTNHVIQCWMFCEYEGFIHGEIELLTNIDHDLCLLDRINA